MYFKVNVDHFFTLDEKKKYESAQENKKFFIEENLFFEEITMIFKEL